MKRGLISLILMLTLLCSLGEGTARAQEPIGPVYIVQSGDSLWWIAQRFGVSMDDLARANGITDTGQLKAGDKLIIPGLEDIQGTLITKTVPFGESLRSLSRRYQVSVSILARLNHLTSPSELYTGADLIIPDSSTVTPTVTTLGRRDILSSGQSLLEMAVAQGTDPWTLVATNALSGTWDAISGDVLRAQGEAPDGPGALPAVVTSVDIKPLPFVQGKTTVISIATAGEVSFNGSLTGHELHFYQEGAGKYGGLQGIHAMLEPGFYPLEINGQLTDGTLFAFSQLVYVRDGGYPYEKINNVDPATLDPAVTKPEDEQWNSLTAAASPLKMWNGIFQNPSSIPLSSGFPSYFGNRRSYNGGPYSYFHTGLDMYGAMGAPIYAPAPGIIVFAGPLTVRGNATVIDHGWGVYTAYEHQSEFKVQVGDHVEAGQVIGLVGNTGRVVGPHLHFEVWVGGVQVDPLEWLQQAYP
jgi:murein DD-endopeptidase MepM/ murein hydrolase activator NlpD